MRFYLSPLYPFSSVRTFNMITPIHRDCATSNVDNGRRILNILEKECILVRISLSLSAPSQKISSQEIFFPEKNCKNFHASGNGEFNRRSIPSTSAYLHRLAPRRAAPFLEVLSCSMCTRAEFLFAGTITQDLGRQAGLITVTDTAVLNWQRVTYLLMASGEGARPRVSTRFPRLGKARGETRVEE